MDGWVDQLMDVSVDGWTNENVWMDECMGGWWVDEQMCGYMDGWKDDGWMDGGEDERNPVSSCGNCQELHPV